MPVNRAWNLEALMAAVRRYPLAPRQRVFFEYVLLEGVNDSADEAQRLARLLRNVRAKVADRHAIRRTRGPHPDARVVVTGCWAQTSADEVARQAGVDLVVGNADKEPLPALLAEVLKTPRGPARVEVGDLRGARVAD